MSPEVAQSGHLKTVCYLSAFSEQSGHANIHEVPMKRERAESARWDAIFGAGGSLKNI